MDYMKLPIDSVELDIDNPRIKQYLEIYGGHITSEGIALALNAGQSTSGSTYDSLRESIRVNGGIISPIIVNKNAEGRYIVVEGNTRVQIYKEFAETDPDGPWDSIIAIVYDNMPTERIHAIRLQAHLVGPRDWDPFSKAKYLNQLSNIDKMPMQTIISFCGGKASEIRKLIDAYTDMVTYYMPQVNAMGYDFDPREFSKFAELQNRSIQTTLDVHHYTKDDFAKWVIEGHVDTAQNVRKLPDVLANPAARSVFLNSTITEAVKKLHLSSKDAPDLSAASLYELADEVAQRIRTISWPEVKALKESPSKKKALASLLDMFDETKGLLTDIGIDLDE